MSPRYVGLPLVSPPPPPLLGDLSSAVVGVGQCLTCCYPVRGGAVITALNSVSWIVRSLAKRTKCSERVKLCPVGLDLASSNPAIPHGLAATSL